MFLKQLRYSFNPYAQKLLTRKHPARSIGFLVKLLLLSFFITGILMLPTLTEWPSLAAWQLAKFDLSINADVNADKPVLLPTSHPFLIIDLTTNQRAIDSENILLTRKYLEYKIGRDSTRIEFSELNNAEAKTKIAILLTLLILPSVIFWILLACFVKYFLWSFSVSLLAWVILDLTQYKKRFLRIFAASNYSMVYVIPLEIILGGEWLIPFAELFRIKFYTITTALYFVVFILTIAFIMTEENQETENEDEKT